MNSRRFLAILMSATLMTLALGVSPAAADEGDGCYYPTFKTKYKILSRHTAAELTHARGIDLSPHGKFVKEAKVSYQKSLKAEVEFHADASFTAGRVIASATVSAGIRLKAAGTWTVRKDWTDKFEIYNKSNKNQRYALYAGTTKHSGRYRIVTCGSDYKIDWQEGKWRSWAVQDGGSAQCGKSPASALGRKALNKVC